MTYDSVEGADGLVLAEPRQEVFFAVRPISATGISEADLEEYFRISSAWLPPLSQRTRSFVDAEVVGFHRNMVLCLRLGNRWTVRRFAAGDSFGDITGNVIDGDGSNGVDFERVQGNGELEDTAEQSATSHVVRCGGSVQTFLRGAIFDSEAGSDFEFVSIDLVPVPLSRDRYGVHFADLGEPVDISIGASPDRIRFIGDLSSSRLVDLITASSVSGEAYHFQVRDRLLDFGTATRGYFGMGTLEEELRQHRRLCTYLDYFLARCDLGRGHSLAIEVCCLHLKTLHDCWCRRALEAWAQRHEAQRGTRGEVTDNIL